MYGRVPVRLAFCTSAYLAKYYHSIAVLARMVRQCHSARAWISRFPVSPSVAMAAVAVDQSASTTAAVQQWSKWAWAVWRVQVWWRQLQWRLGQFAAAGASALSHPVAQFAVILVLLLAVPGAGAVLRKFIPELATAAFAVAVLQCWQFGAIIQLFPRLAQEAERSL